MARRDVAVNIWPAVGQNLAVGSVVMIVLSCPPTFGCRFNGKTGRESAQQRLVAALAVKTGSKIVRASGITDTQAQPARLHGLRKTHQQTY